MSKEKFCIGITPQIITFTVPELASMFPGIDKSVLTSILILHKGNKKESINYVVEYDDLLSKLDREYAVLVDKENEKDGFLIIDGNDNFDGEENNRQANQILSEDFDFDDFIEGQLPTPSDPTLLEVLDIAKDDIVEGSKYISKQMYDRAKWALSLLSAEEEEFSDDEDFFDEIENAEDIEEFSIAQRAKNRLIQIIQKHNNESTGLKEETPVVLSTEDVESSDDETPLIARISKKGKTQSLKSVVVVKGSQSEEEVEAIIQKFDQQQIDDDVFDVDSVKVKVDIEEKEI